MNHKIHDSSHICRLEDQAVNRYYLLCMSIIDYYDVGSKWVPFLSSGSPRGRWVSRTPPQLASI